MLKVKSYPISPASIDPKHVCVNSLLRCRLITLPAVFSTKGGRHVLSSHSCLIRAGPSWTDCVFNKPALCAGTSAVIRVTMIPLGQNTVWLFDMRIKVVNVMRHESTERRRRPDFLKETLSRLKAANRFQCKAETLHIHIEVKCAFVSGC